MTRARRSKVNTGTMAEESDLEAIRARRMAELQQQFRVRISSIFKIS